MSAAILSAVCAGMIGFAVGVHGIVRDWGWLKIMVAAIAVGSLTALMAWGMAP